MPPELITFFSAMLPVTELRAAIPVAIKIFHLSPLSAFTWGVLGNLVPNFFILWLLGPISSFVMKRSKFLNKVITKIFDKTRSRHSKIFNEMGAIFLISFVAIPIPGSGSWSGSLIAFIFGIPYWKAITLISLGVVGAGILITLGAESIFGMINLVTRLI